MRADEFEVVHDAVLGEEVWMARTARGLVVRVVPSERFRETAAVVGFRYGSTDLGFIENGVVHHSPEGVAHYLEHKLFEDEALAAFDRFARRGAQVNATTGFGRTLYYFTATSRVAENLADLLHLVSRAHITPENVAKERGIIAQEIRMYEDSADYRGFFDLLGCLYPQHPLRHPVAGTVESIQQITAEELLRCYGAFYRAGNAALAVAGPVDPSEVLALAQGSALAAGQAPSRTLPAAGQLATQHIERRLQVARPRILLGFRDEVVLPDPSSRLRRELVTRLLLDRLFSMASEVREELRQSGLLDDSLTASHMAAESFGFTVVGCKTEQPARTLAALRSALTSASASSAEHLERVRRKVLGQYVRSFESNRSIAFQHLEEALEAVPPFGAIARIESIHAEEIAARQREHCRDESSAEAIVS